MTEERVRDIRMIVRLLQAQASIHGISLEAAMLQSGSLKARLPPMPKQTEAFERQRAWMTLHNREYEKFCRDVKEATGIELSTPSAIVTVAHTDNTEVLP